MTKRMCDLCGDEMPGRVEVTVYYKTIPVFIEVSARVGVGNTRCDVCLRCLAQAFAQANGGTVHYASSPGRD